MFEFIMVRLYLDVHPEQILDPDKLLLLKYANEYSLDSSVRLQRRSNIWFHFIQWESNQWRCCLRHDAVSFLSLKLEPELKDIQ